MEQDRYFIDQRVGCIAIRDRKNSDDTNGLHSDTLGAVHYWSGVNGPEGWEVPEDFCKAAKLTCDAMNRLCR